MANIYKWTDYTWKDNYAYWEMYKTFASQPHTPIDKTILEIIGKNAVIYVGEELDFQIKTNADGYTIEPNKLDIVDIENNKIIGLKEGKVNLLVKAKYKECESKEIVWTIECKIRPIEDDNNNSIYTSLIVLPKNKYIALGEEQTIAIITNADDYEWESDNPDSIRVDKENNRLIGIALTTPDPDPKKPNQKVEERYVTITVRAKKEGSKEGKVEQWTMQCKRPNTFTKLLVHNKKKYIKVNQEINLMVETNARNYTVVSSNTASVRIAKVLPDDREGIFKKLIGVKKGKGITIEVKARYNSAQEEMVRWEIECLGEDEEIPDDGNGDGGTGGSGGSGSGSGSSGGGNNQPTSDGKFLKIMANILDDAFQRAEFQYTNVIIVYVARTLDFDFKPDFQEQILEMVLKIVAYWSMTILPLGIPVTAGALVTMNMNNAYTITPTLLMDLIQASRKQPKGPPYEDMCEAIFENVKKIQWNVTETQLATGASIPFVNKVLQ